MLPPCGSASAGSRTGTVARASPDCASDSGAAVDWLSFERRTNNGAARQSGGAIKVELFVPAFQVTNAHFERNRSTAVSGGAIAISTTAHLQLTNVHLRGRALAAKTFTGQLRDNLLVFDPLGPGAYENVGMSGGPGILTFNARKLGAATDVYMEPDFIMLTAPGERVRHTVLYRDGEAARTLTARGTRLWPTCDRRHPLDPRGDQGPVHEQPFSSTIWCHLAADSVD